MSAILEVHNLTKVYGETRAVDEITLSVKQGSLFGLLGPNGSGKSTMIKMLTGQIRPTAGSATVLGLDVEKDPVGVRSQVGIIPEQETPPSFLTAEEYLDFVGKVRAIPDIEEQKAWWFEFLEFGDKRTVLCKDLSRGTRQKLMFAQAFLHRPVLALIDEPLINFDPIMQEKVKDYLGAYVKEGNTVFISTHILEIAEEICSDFAVLHTGKLLATGGISEVTESGRHLGEYFLSLVRTGVHA
ncbi:ABC transporter ATP-binding protein [Methanofollis formosanus]|uniref:ABC transporter ATP-binding protein n=1 Tax=Methanofollis formosanus TaxID=299308 RepID=A0A8G1EES5_9EURY|nr:ABC transporter ATP-binding protein [Methanofollis formosanus]QYZ78328.1 ABC transporter ATP-binding protein [Methanofollis formosanus]